MVYEYVLFDLDGTLTDPGIGITNSVMYALSKFGITETDRSKLYPFIGPPLADSFKEFYGFSDDKSWQGVEFYREYFGDRGIYENQVYEGIYEVLTELKAKGIKLCVATSKPTEYTIRILEKFNLSKYFDVVSGSAMDEKNSDKAEIIRYAVQKGNIDCSKALMIGDRKFDIIGAKTNNIASVGVLYGYGTKEELMNENADYIVSTPKELLNIVLR